MEHLSSLPTPIYHSHTGRAVSESGTLPPTPDPRGPSTCGASHALRVRHPTSHEPAECRARGPAPRPFRSVCSWHRPFPTRRMVLRVMTNARTRTFPRNVYHRLQPVGASLSSGPTSTSSTSDSPDSSSCASPTLAAGHAGGGGSRATGVFRATPVGSVIETPDAVAGEGGRGAADDEGKAGGASAIGTGLADWAAGGLGRCGTRCAPAAAS
jgi:hypothetical protein